MSAASMTYVVQGSSGEYSDWTTWLVVAYEKEETARQHAESAEALVLQRKEFLREMDFSAREKWVKENPNPLDPDCPSEEDYDDITYTVNEVRRRTRLPRAKA